MMVNHDGVFRILLHRSQWCGQNLRTSFLSACQECNLVVWKVSIPYILWIHHPTHAHPHLHTSHTLLRVLLAPLALLVHLVQKEPRVFLDQMAQPETMDDLDHLWVREGDASQNISVPVLGHAQKFCTVINIFIITSSHKLHCFYHYIITLLWLYHYITTL